MIASLFGRFFRARRGATAVAMAIMFVPLLICAGAAVDFSRLASARSLMQSSVDGASISGGGAYQMSENNTSATNVATSTFQATSSQLSKFVSNITVDYGVYCSAAGTNTQCGSTTIGQYASGAHSGQCLGGFSGSASKEYCIIVSASATLKNSLLGFLIPSDALSVTSIEMVPFPLNNVSGKNIPPSPGFGQAGDISNISAYAVPMTGLNSTPNYGKMADPNAACANQNSPLKYFADTNLAGTTCNYLFIANSNSNGAAGAGGSIGLASNQPIAFAFINETGANGYYQTVPETTEILYSLSSSSGYTYAPSGQNIYGLTTSNVTCTNPNADNSCPAGDSTTTTSNANSTTPTNSTTTCTATYSNGRCKTETTISTTSTTALASTCPDHTLYGSLSQSDGAPSNPPTDSLNEYSSAYEVIGYSPSHTTNHILTPFISSAVTQSINGVPYFVEAVCPNYPAATGISAPMTSTYANTTLGSTQFAGMNVYSTWFPDQTYSDGTGAGNTYPPELAGCTPTTIQTTTSGGSSTYWNWTGSNLGQCTLHNAKANTTVSNNQQAAAYSDCALVIQQLGTNVPVSATNYALVPDYYNLIENSTGRILGLDPVYDSTNYIELITGGTPASTGIAVYQGPGTWGGVTAVAGQDVIVNTNPAGYYPTPSQPVVTPVGSVASPVTITQTTYDPQTGTAATTSTSYTSATYSVTEQPAYAGNSTYDHSLPDDTSHQCYNPGANGINGNTVNATTGTSLTSAGVTNHDTGLAIDPVSNPQYGAIFCNSQTPETYALYWNDMGTYETDDLGFWNAIETFTCSVPSTTNAGGGPPTLSG